jgi:hypothetical protein
VGCQEDFQVQEGQLHALAELLEQELEQDQRSKQSIK